MYCSGGILGTHHFYSVLQLQCVAAQDPTTVSVRCSCNLIATHCNMLQHTATHYNTLQHTATHCNAIQIRDTCHFTCNQVPLAIQYVHKTHSVHIHTSATCNPLAIKWIHVYTNPTLYIYTQVPSAIHLQSNGYICTQVYTHIHKSNYIHMYTSATCDHLQSTCNQVYTYVHKSNYIHMRTSATCNPVAIKCIHIYSSPTIYTYTQVLWGGYD